MVTFTLITPLSYSRNLKKNSLPLRVPMKLHINRCDTQLKDITMHMLIEWAHTEQPRSLIKIATNLLMSWLQSNSLRYSRSAGMATTISTTGGRRSRPNLALIELWSRRTAVSGLSLRPGVTNSSKRLPRSYRRAQWLIILTDTSNPNLVCAGVCERFANGIWCPVELGWSISHMTQSLQKSLKRTLKKLLGRMPACFKDRWLSIMNNSQSPFHVSMVKDGES